MIDIEIKRMMMKISAAISETEAPWRPADDTLMSNNNSGKMRGKPKTAMSVKLFFAREAMAEIRLSIAAKPIMPRSIFKIKRDMETTGFPMKEIKTKNPVSPRPSIKMAL